MQKKQLGSSGETHCVNYLKERGYEILKQNFHSPYGEIDIIAKEGHHLVFIEVKTRTKESIDKAKYSITYSKQKKITKTAMYFLQDFVDKEIREYRFDVIILKKEGNTIDLEHFKDAFPPAEVGDFFA
jgi:putative endonuclease